MTGILSRFQESFRLKVVSLLGLTALADFLFYGHDTGWTAGLFGLLFLFACVLHNARILKSRAGQVICAMTLVQCVLQIEKASPLCFVLMSLGIGSLAVLSQGGWERDAGIWLKKVLSLIARAWYPLEKACAGVQKHRHRFLPSDNISQLLRGWFLPVVLSGVFIALFTNANPVMTRWVSGFDLIGLLHGFSVWRLFFWLVAASFVFSAIRPKLKSPRKKPSAQTAAGKRKPMKFSEWAFTKKAVLRSLVIFNLIFAFQTLMDVNYLWAGGALPAEISYAEYAQQGAYPLVVTALLAALFVLVSQNAGHEVSGSRIVRALIYVWVAQNLMLVISSIYRTGLYVEVYALTYLRVAAFIWMGLVACGLYWIIVRSVMNKSNTWLVNANVLTLLAVLYVTSFVNIGAMIANYNVTHSKELSGKGVKLDVRYLESIGSAAVPALIQYSLHEKAHGRIPGTEGVKNRYNSIDKITNRLKRDMGDWRRWTYSEHRMLEFLEGTGE